MNISASQLAYQGIQNGFKDLADNTARLNPQNNQNKPLPEATELKQAPQQSLESMLIDNKQTATQIEALAKVIKTEDQLIGKLLEDWA